tara:strand:+ start:1044 stop:1982 length:939 start_codon:yes stop_codon:yes gene_type:complete
MTEENSLKLFINKANEKWIIDRLRDEWVRNHNPYTRFYKSSNMLWIIAPWKWDNTKLEKNSSRKVVCSVYHIDEEKFNKSEVEKFNFRDQFVDAYHVISKKTLDQVRKYTDKKIYSIPFWINPEIWYPIENKDQLRKKYNIPVDSYLIGSFQRDTEGSDLKSPKLSKGPDRFIEIVKTLKEKNEKLHILLSGKRRQYVISKLLENDINFTYFEMVTNSKLNELYNCLDLYIVTSRVEGGPQAVFESALTKTPIISTNVGVAPEILSPNSLFDMNNFESAKPDVEYAFGKLNEFTIPNGFKSFNKMFNEVFDA